MKSFNVLSKSFISIFVVIIMIISIMVFTTGCGAPAGYTIKPNESAFLIPYNGNTKDSQAKFDSEEFLNENKIAGKRVTINKEYSITFGNAPVAKLIIIDRAPVTREWTGDTSTGTSSANQAFVAESNQSIAFAAQMNCTCYIKEDDAAKFLYRYPEGSKLSEVMDRNIRPYIADRLTRECSKYEMSNIIKDKSKILDAVNLDVKEYFGEMGITIAQLGFQGEFTYLDKKIQDSINAKFTSENDLISQRNKNTKAVEKAEADAKAIKIQAETIQYQIRLKELENQANAIDKWNGKSPTYIAGDSGNIFNVPIK